MEQVFARRNYVLLHDDGSIHYPFSKFLTNEFTNPHTRELVAQSLRIFYRFCAAHQIELVFRAQEGRCLTYDEAKKLAELCYADAPGWKLETTAPKNRWGTAIKLSELGYKIYSWVDEDGYNNFANWVGN